MIDSFYQQTTDEIENIISNKGYRIETIRTDDTPLDLGFYIFIKNNADEEVGVIKISKTIDYISIGKTKSKMKQLLTEEAESLQFNIPILSIHEAYKGKGLGQLLLIYGICFMNQFNENNEIHYVTLEDMSDNNDVIGKNVYDSISFEPIGFVSINLAKSNQSDKGSKIILENPIKQLSFYDPEVKRRIINIIEKYKKKGKKKNKMVSRKIQLKKIKIHKSKKTKTKKYKY
jgi:hypothetical protein